MSGVIAVDIDGTLVGSDYTVTPAVAAEFEKFVDDGWEFIVITGRSYSWAKGVLESLLFPFHLAVQNGAMDFQMPLGERVSDCFLDRETLRAAVAICEELGTGLVVYDHKDRGYYCSNHFDPEMAAYLKERALAQGEPWVDVNDFDEVELEAFPSMKCFGDHQLTTKVADRLIAELAVAAPHIRDPYREGIFVTQATAEGANKGAALIKIIRRYKHPRPLIVVGDDHNDYAMLQIADVKVVMATAPEALLKIADIIAPPADEEGIIHGVKEAIQRVT